MFILKKDMKLDSLSGVSAVMRPAFKEVDEEGAKKYVIDDSPEKADLVALALSMSSAAEDLIATNTTLQGQVDTPYAFDVLKKYVTDIEAPTEADIDAAIRQEILNASSENTEAANKRHQELMAKKMEEWKLQSEAVKGPLETQIKQLKSELDGYKLQGEVSTFIANGNPLRSEIPLEAFVDFIKPDFEIHRPDDNPSMAKIYARGADGERMPSLDQMGPMEIHERLMAMKDEPRYGHFFESKVAASPRTQDRQVTAPGVAPYGSVATSGGPAGKGNDIGDGSAAILNGLKNMQSASGNRPVVRRSIFADR